MSCIIYHWNTPSICPITYLKINCPDAFQRGSKWCLCESGNGWNKTSWQNHLRSRHQEMTELRTNSRSLNLRCSQGWVVAALWSFLGCSGLWFFTNYFLLLSLNIFLSITCNSRHPSASQLLYFSLGFLWLLLLFLCTSSEIPSLVSQAAAIRPLWWIPSPL